MAADSEAPPSASHASARRTSSDVSSLAPLPDHRNVNTPWWQEQWHRHQHITTPLRQRGLECDIEFGLSAYIVRVSLPDSSYLIIGPPQEPSSDRTQGNPEGWIVTREHPHDQASHEVLYDSAPSADPGVPERPEARHGGSIPPLIKAIDQRLTQLGVLASPVPPAGNALAPPATPTLHAPAVPGTASVYVYGDSLLALTDQLKGAESHADAALLLHQVLAPIDGLLDQLGEFFDAAGEKAKEAEQDDGADLGCDLAHAAAEVRSLVETLHVAEDRMRALTAPPRPHRPTASPAPVPRPPLAALPTGLRHTR
ncbi:hypothetical protein [Streptomyces sp. NPDC018352]|uniref:hypothetical protein n=1 Tax=Streptomyces sp. NPDC018352 TaxID=3157194 RepID=UPI0033E7F441